MDGGWGTMRAGIHAVLSMIGTDGTARQNILQMRGACMGLRGFVQASVGFARLRTGAGQILRDEGWRGGGVACFHIVMMRNHGLHTGFGGRRCNIRHECGNGDDDEIGEHDASLFQDVKWHAGMAARSRLIVARFTAKRVESLRR